MLKIQRFANREVEFRLSGRIEPEDVDELSRLFGLEASGRDLALDLADVTLVDRLAVSFLASCENDGIELRNCPVYVREWLEKNRSNAGRKH
jgi:hypothetical protein